LPTGIDFWENPAVYLRALREEIPKYDACILVLGPYLKADTWDGRNHLQVEYECAYFRGQEIYLLVPSKILSGADG